MASAGHTQPNAEELLLAITALLIDEREKRVADEPDAARIEVLLDSCGLSYKTIAAITGKQEDAVRMAITRANARPKTKPGAKKSARATSKRR
ncbi:MAG: hypothetical protein E6G34_01980 [Actinobacteria bacterium]|nr:MAG: hypothetical protein E6G34_01980 [Actinomycetota bacterium]